MINNKITVVTVTFNNAMGLEKTLNSLQCCNTKPKRIIVVDGGSIDSTKKVVRRYQKNLSILFISEKDQGIYDAMNKGRAILRTPLVHYLNAGDVVFGDPYLNCEDVGILEVIVRDPESQREWPDFIKLSGYGYCHQGLILPSDHKDYNINYRIAADFDLISKSFPKGLGSLPVFKSGYVIYELGGVSSEYSSLGDLEILSSAIRNLSNFNYLKIYIFLKIKKLIPRILRRYFAFSLLY